MPIEFGNRDNFQSEMDAIGRDESKAHVFSLACRPGTRLFFTKIEYVYYAPRSGRNKLFDFRIIKWPHDTGLLWFVGSIPADEFRYAEEIAVECGLRLEKTTAINFAPGGPEEFPVHGATVYALAGKLAPGIDETALCDNIIAADDEVHQKSLRDRGFTDAQIGRLFAEWAAGNDAYNEVPENA